MKNRKLIIGNYILYASVFPSPDNDIDDEHDPSRR